MKILQSRDYERFELHEVNRDVGNTEALEASMRKSGWIDAYPLHVVKGAGGQLKIKGGHHRFTIAKKLGLAIKYVICDDDATIVELEKATSPWRIKDYLASHIRSGIADYAELDRYCTRTGIPVLMAASMFYGQTAGSGNVLGMFKAGRFKIRDRSKPASIEDIVTALRAERIPCHNAQRFIQALSRMLFVPEFLAERFKAKAVSHAHMMAKKATVKEYTDMIEAVYNRQSKDKDRVPLAFLADQCAKDRNIAGSKATGSMGASDTSMTYALAAKGL